MWHGKNGILPMWSSLKPVTHSNDEKNIRQIQVEGQLQDTDHYSSKLSRSLKTGRVWCYDPNVSSKIHVGNLIPNATVLGGGSFERCLGHENGVLVITLMPLLKGGTWKSGFSGLLFCILPFGDSVQRPTPDVSALILDFPVSRLWKNKFLFFTNYPVPGTLF